MGHSSTTAALLGCSRKADFGSLMVFLPHPNILDPSLSFRQQQASSGVYGIGVIRKMKAGLAAGGISEGSAVLHLYVPDYLSTLFLKTLCGIRALLSSVSASQCSCASHISLFIPAFPRIKIPPSFVLFCFFLMTLVLHGPISSPLPLPPLFSLNTVLASACVCII